MTDIDKERSIDEEDRRPDSQEGMTNARKETNSARKNAGYEKIAGKRR